MLLYNLRLAWTSIRRTPVLSALLVCGIALGVGVATGTGAAYHVLSQDPLPGQSDRLHYVRLDSWDPAAPHPDPSGIPPQITQRDMRGLLGSTIPVRQTGTYRSRLLLEPPRASDRPFNASVRLAFADFFPMFEVPFRYGAPWTKAADARPEPIVVLSAETNDRLFGGADSVGRTVRLGGKDFRVAGVLAEWRPRVRYYDLTNGGLDEPEDVFLPFNWTAPMELGSAGNSDGWKSAADDSFAAYLDSEQTWIQFWAELAGPRQVAEYRAFLDAYAREQKRLGRFGRPLDNRATPMMALMDEFGIVPDGVQALALVGLLFLVVCSVNLVGLFLGKFLSRAPAVGVRRALGASRGTIFLQHLVECELTGLVGGAFGLLLALGELALLNRVVGQMLRREDYFQLDGTMLAAAAVLSLVAGLIAGVYPSWKVCAVPPAQHLKTQ